MEEERLCPICGTISKTPFVDGRDFYFLCLNTTCPVEKIYGSNAVKLLSSSEEIANKTVFGSGNSEG